MVKRSLYGAYPINTYGTPVGIAYHAFLSDAFPAMEVVDPNGAAIKAAVEKIKAKYPDPATYDKVGAREVMDYFVHLVQAADEGVGLALPMKTRDGATIYCLPAGIAKELGTIHANKKPIWVALGTNRSNSTKINSSRDPYFFLHKITAITPFRQAESDLLMFSCDGAAFSSLTIDETRGRIYTKKDDGSWDRDNLQPYFLD